MTASGSYLKMRSTSGERAATKSLPMDRRDRPWVDTNVTIVCGPFATPSVDTIRGAVDLVATHFPQSRIAWGFDDHKRRWHVGRSPESIVVERMWDEEASFADVIDDMARDASLEAPLSFVRYPNHFGMKMAHALGDGQMFVTILAAALVTAATGQVMPWPTTAAGRLPLLRAGLRTFGRKPALLRSTVRDRFRTESTEPQGNSRRWQGSRCTSYMSLPSELTEEIHAWSAANAPGASRFAIQATLLLRALRRIGMAISNDVRVMVDLRSYLGAGPIDGNFFAGVPMRLNWDMSPDEISAVVRTTRASGRPLANQMATSLRVGAPAPPPQVVAQAALPQVTFSYLGAPAPVDLLPYLPDHQPVYAASVEPGGPNGLTFVHGHCRGQMILNACFHDNVIDSDAIETAMKLIQSDPLGLLSEQGVSR